MLGSFSKSIAVALEFLQHRLMENDRVDYALKGKILVPENADSLKFVKIHLLINPLHDDLRALASEIITFARVVLYRF